MPTILTCSCGKQIQLTDEMSGKRIRCRQCDTIIDTAASGTATLGETLPRIRMRCGCGKQFDVPSNLAGRIGRCPGCNEKLTIPAPTQASQRQHTQAAPPPATLDFAPPANRNECATLDAPPPGQPQRINDAPTLDAEGPRQSGKIHGKHFGDYELLNEIARGGMGVVYKARQKSLQRVVALKMILGGEFASSEQIRRFHVEAEEAGKLDHPNIVPIYQVGQHDEHHFFSMKLIEGGSLVEYMADYRKTPREAAELMIKIARAVHYAHQRGVLHRDLKPGNILIDPEGEPHITDFGLAKHMGEKGATQSGAILGTPGYMAPEQAAGKADLSVAADVHGLGAILYDLLTGEPPFHAETVFDTIMQVIERDAEPLRPKNPKVPADLETICLKCLQKDPGRRYTSADALANDLERFLKREPIRARPVSRFERMVLWARRRPTAAALVAVSMLAFLALSIGGLWFTVQLQAALTASKENLRIAQQERERAMSTFHKGIETIDDMLINFDGRLAKKPDDMDSVRVEFLQEFLSFSQRLQQERPHDPVARRQLARVHARIGDLLRQSGSIKEANAAFTEAVTLHQGLANEFKDVPQHTYDLAQTHAQHARLYLRARETASAIESLSSAVTVAKELAQSNPNDLQYRQFAIGLHFERANVIEEAGKASEAKPLYEVALAEQEKLIVDFPKNAPAYNLLGQINDSLASLHERSNPAECERYLRKSLAAQREAWKFADHIYDDSVRSAYTELGSFFQRRRMHTHLAELATELATEGADSRLDTYNAACFMANAADSVEKSSLSDEEKNKLVEHYGELSVKLLQKAVQAGYASKRGDREHMDRDTDLDPLRQREDYKALLAGIDERSPRPPQTPALQVTALANDYRSAVASYRSALSEATTAAQKRRARATQPSLAQYAGRFLDLAEKHPKESAALNALDWVLERTDPDTTTSKDAALRKVRARAFTIFRRDHLMRPDLDDICATLATAAQPDADQLLRAIIEKNPEAKMRGVAALALGLSLATQAEQWRESNAKRADSLAEQAQQQLRLVVEKFDNVTLGQSTTGALARRKLMEMKHLSAGSAAQEITGDDLNGKPLRLSEHRGKVVVLDFWANWCGYCRREYGFQRQMVDRLAGKPFVLLGVNCDEEAEPARRAVTNNKLNWRSWFDGGPTGGRIRQQWQVDSFPTLYVLDHKGVIRYKGLRGPQLEDAVRTLLAEMDAAKGK